MSVTSSAVTTASNVMLGNLKTDWGVTFDVNWLGLDFQTASGEPVYSINFGSGATHADIPYTPTGQFTTNLDGSTWESTQNKLLGKKHLK